MESSDVKHPFVGSTEVSCEEGPTMDEDDPSEVGSLSLGRSLGRHCITNFRVRVLDHLDPNFKWLS